MPADLLECAWPRCFTPPRTAGCADLARGDGGFNSRNDTAMGYDAFIAAVSVELGRWGGVRRNHRILRAI